MPGPAEDCLQDRAAAAAAAAHVTGPSRNAAPSPPVQHDGVAVLALRVCKDGAQQAGPLHVVAHGAHAAHDRAVQRGIPVEHQLALQWMAAVQQRWLAAVQSSLSGGPEQVGAGWTMRGWRASQRKQLRRRGAAAGRGSGAHREAHGAAATLGLHAGQRGVVQPDRQIPGGALGGVEVRDWGSRGREGPAWGRMAGGRWAFFFGRLPEGSMRAATPAAHAALRSPRPRRPAAACPRQSAAAGRPAPAPELADGKPISRRTPSPSGRRRPGSVSSTTPGLGCGGRQVLDQSTRAGLPGARPGRQSSRLAGGGRRGGVGRQGPTCGDQRDAVAAVPGRSSSPATVGS